jgi:hypothetical protein
MSAAPRAPRHRIGRWLRLEDRCLPSVTVTNLTDHDAGSLRLALDQVNAGGSIDFAPGLHGTIPLQSPLVIPQALTIAGPGAGVITLDGGGVSPTGASHRVITNRADGVTISGLTIAHGVDASPNLSQGGGILNAGTMTLDKVVLTGNQATGFGEGGGVYNLGTLTVTNSAFIANGTLRSGIGGGIFNLGTLTATNCSFAQNLGQQGGGLDVSGNSVHTSLTNCTFAFNSVLDNGGGVTVAFGSGPVQILNTIIADNGSENELPDFSNGSAAGTVTVDHSIVTGTQATIHLDTQQFDTSGPTPTIALLSNSPAIDAGNPAGAPATDQRGVPRDARPDMGAYEFQGTATTPTTTGLVASPTNLTFGTQVMFTAGVSAGAGQVPTGGTVSFKDTFNGTTTTIGTADLTPNGQGLAHFTTTTPLAVGTHSVVAVYGGGGSIQGSSSPAVTVQVNPVLQGTTTGLVFAPPAPKFGQPVSFTATVSGGAAGTPTTGTVTFTDTFNGQTATLGTADLTPTGGGVVTFTPTTPLAASAHSVTAAFGGGGTFGPSTSPAVSVPVGKADTVITLVVSPNPPVVGQPVKVMATVAGTVPGLPAPTGFIEFAEKFASGGSFTGKQLTGGSGELDIASLPPGGEQVTVTYDGDDNFNTSTNAVTLSAGKSATTITVTARPNPVAPGQQVVLTIKVVGPPNSGTPTGTVDLTDAPPNNPQSQGVHLTLQNGQATVTRSAPAAGDYAASLTYDGDANFSTSSTTITVPVTKGKAPTHTALLYDPVGIFGFAPSIDAVVTPDAPGGPPPTGAVAIFDGTTLLFTGGVQPGGDIIPTALPAGAQDPHVPHSFHAVYEGDGFYAGSTSPDVVPPASNVATHTINGPSGPETVTFTSPPGTAIRVRLRDPGSLPPLPFSNPRVGFNLGLFDITVFGLPPGGKADVTIQLPADVPVNAYWKYGPRKVTLPSGPATLPAMWYPFLQRGDFGAAFDPVNHTVTLHLEDGQIGDSDLTADGTITDPGGPASQPGLFATGAGPGGGPQVNVYNADGSLRFAFFAFDPSFTGGVRVATGDVNGDGVPDVIAAAGPGGGPAVAVYDGLTGAELMRFFAYDQSFTGGVYVAAADVNGDGFADIVTGAGPTGGPHVKVFDGQTGAELQSFFAYDQSFTGGVTVAAADVNRDGHADIITGAASSGGPQVNVFDGATGALQKSFFALDPTFTGGISVAAADVTGDGVPDIVAGAGPGSLPFVLVFDAVSGQLVQDFFAYDPSFTGGVSVATIDLLGDGVATILTGPGSSGGPQVTARDARTLAELQDLAAYDPTFLGGVLVG